MSQAGILSDVTSPAADVETLTGNTGGAVGPNGSFNINTIGDTSKGITVAGSPGTNTLTWSFSPSSSQTFAFLSQLNVGALTPDFNYNVNIQSSAATPLGISLRNKDTTAAAEVDIVMESHGTGDIQTNLLYFSGESFSYGMDASDSKAFKISRSSVLGTNDAIRIDQSSGAIKFNNAYTFPTADGSNAQYLGTNGAGVLSFSNPNDALTYTAVSTTPYVVTSTDEFLSVNTGTAKTIQLPNAPSTGRVFIIKDRTGSANANNITVTTVGGAVNIDGATTYAINQNYGSIQVLFNGSSYEVF